MGTNPLAVVGPSEAFGARIPDQKKHRSNLLNSLESMTCGSSIWGRSG